MKDCGKIYRITVSCGCVQMLTYRCNKTIRLGTRAITCGSGAHDSSKGDYIKLLRDAVARRTSLLKNK